MLDEVVDGSEALAVLLADLEVELLLDSHVRQRLRGVVSVQNGLLEFLQESLLVEAAQVEAVEVLRAPEVDLLGLFIKDSLVIEGHDHEVRLVGEEAAIRLQEHIPRNDVRLQHSLVE